jgi:hypothetical protein
MRLVDEGDVVADGAQAVPVFGLRSRHHGRPAISAACDGSTARGTDAPTARSAPCEKCATNGVLADPASGADMRAEEGDVLDHGGAEREQAAVAELLGADRERHGRAGAAWLRGRQGERPDRGGDRRRGSSTRARQEVNLAHEGGREQAPWDVDRCRRAVPRSSIRPSRITTMMSATDMASSWSWVTWTKVVPSRCWIAFSSSCIARRSLRSSAPEGFVEQQDVGIDRERAGQRHALALAAGDRVRQAVGRVVEIDQRQHLLRRARGGLARSTPRMRRPKPTFSASDICGNSA